MTLYDSITSPTPTGLPPSAQGCAPSATLGSPAKKRTNPFGVASPRIRCTAEVRRLLVELDYLFQSYHSYTRQLAERGERALDDHMAIEVGAERTMIERLIQNKAYRINLASCKQRAKEAA